ncbi:MAG TPA: ABC transporter substrate-binding protein [Tenuifilaceae bacterium]|nr:ABC transporter substrate-binding protein [Tenuifilaceae bacterium]HPI45054.1 ABC transporter substrate-binding protein [Tenuifilaceae bacterium]
MKKNIVLSHTTLNEKKTNFFFVMAITLFFTLFSQLLVAKSGDKIVVQLQWKHQFQFAGYYAALENGYYKEAGLDVELRDLNSNNINSIDEVIAGRADLGVANSELLVRYMQGEPLIALIPIFQNSPVALAVRGDSEINTPQDFVGKTIELNNNGGSNEILAMLFIEGIKSSQVNIQQSTLSLNNLLNSKVDATAIYQCNEPYFLDRFGIPYKIILPKNYGIDFYAECLFTSQSYLRKHKAKVDKFIEATIQGWDYALKNENEIAQLIQTKYKSTKTLDHLLFEAAQVKKFIQPDFINIGHSNKGRWLHMTEILKQSGIIQTTRSIDGFIYKEKENSNIPFYKYSLISGLVVLAILLFIFFHIKLIKRQKKHNEHTISNLQQKIEQQELEISSLKYSLDDLNKKANELEHFSDSLISNLSFEIRSPLNNILGYCELLSAPRLKQEQTKQYTKEIAKSSKTLQYQIDNLIDLSKLESEQYKLTYQRINLYDFFNTLHIITLNELKLFDKEHITIKTSIDEEEINFDILSDRNILKSVFWRLINNSVKFTTKGYIEIGCKKKSSSSLHLWIQDSGPGIDNKNLNTIFQPFNNNSESPQNSLGLGLPITKRLIEIMNGKIWIETTEGAGTTINFTIPITPVGARSTITKQTPYYLQQDPPQLKDKTIQIVEDIQSNYLLLSKMLEETGCKIIHSKTGEEAITTFNSTPNIDLVFMDLRLTDMDGIEITREIRLSNSNVIIVAQTAYSSGVKVNLSIEAGCNDFITKPISRLDLFNILRKHLSPPDSI